jgi:site-specific DNA-methyltransferase (adenine-specific)
VSRSILPCKGENGVVVHADNLEALARIPDESIDLVYIDPPFNTGRAQARTQTKTSRVEKGGDRTGFGGKRYQTEVLSKESFDDSFSDFEAFIEPRLQEARRVLAKHGSLYVHLDSREVHYVKVQLDRIFGREQFLNEVIWAYDYGGRPKDRWPKKHDNILVYVKTAGAHVFNQEDIDRIPYMAPGLVGPEKAARGKLPTDTWWHTIVSPTGKEKLGWPTQKPIRILERIVSASCPKGGIVLDFFAGSGTTGAAALACKRRFVLIDTHPGAIAVMKKRFAAQKTIRFE